MNGHNFSTVAPNQVIPKPTSLFHRAHSDGFIFTMFAHYENDHFSLVRKQPPPRENCFRQIFFRLFHTSPRSICRTPGKPTSYHEPRTCMLTLLAPCVCVVAVISSCFHLQLFRYAYHACLCFHDIFCHAN